MVDQQRNPGAGDGSTPGGTRAVPAAFVGGLVVVALNLRAPFVAVAPAADRIGDGLGVGSGTVGLLTTLPVLCFSLATPLALGVARRTGPERAASLALLGIVAGALVRSAGPLWAAVAGSVVIGTAITVGNVVSPVLVRRWTPPESRGLVTGVWVAGLNVGSMVVTAATDPLARAVGWQAALLVWGLAAGVGLVAWEVLRRRLPGRPTAPEPAPAPAGDAARGARPHRDLVAWLLAVAFACQAASYYGVTAWLPGMLHDRAGLEPGAAGAAASVFQVLAVVGAIGVPLLARRRGPRTAVALVGALWLVLPLQMLLAPGAWVVGAVLGGIAQGGGLAAVFAAVADLARSDGASARLSAFVQGVGYAVGAAWPTVLGLAHQATGAWTLPLLLTLLTTGGFTVLGLLAHRPAVRTTADASR